jgi:hypothetical protein
MTAEQNLDSALAGIELQFGRLSKSKEQRREDELIAERMDSLGAEDPNPYPQPPVKPPQVGGDEEAWDAFIHSEEGKRWWRRVSRWRGRAWRRSDAVRREVRGELRRESILARRRPTPRPRLVLRPLRVQDARARHSGAGKAASSS